MRRWFIAVALLVNALSNGLVLLALLNDGGWGETASLSTTAVGLLLVMAAAALLFTLLLVPVLGISFWARDRGFRRQEAELHRQRQPASSDDTRS